MLVFRKLFFFSHRKYIHKNGKLYWCRRDCQDAFLALPRSPGAKYQTPKYSARALRWAGDSSAFLIHHKWNENGIKNLSFDVLIAVVSCSSCVLYSVIFVINSNSYWWLIAIKRLLTSYPWLFGSQLDTVYYTDCCDAWGIWMF